MSEPLLKVENLKQFFRINRHFTVKAVDGVSFEIYPGETYGLVGESGSGKSTIGRSVIRLYDPTHGKITFDGLDVSGKMEKEAEKHLRIGMQMIFQDPMACLNPRKKVSDIIAQGLDIHHLYQNTKERNDKISEILEQVGLAPEHATRYPHQFSGGQRQRVGIARALSVGPEFIVCDEAISALDVSIQAQVINLLMRLQKQLGLTYLFIAHDLSMVRHVADDVAVMYLGTLVETASADALFDHPMHPYTIGLLAAAPEPDPDFEQGRESNILAGEVPSAINPKPGCRFCPRCSYATDECRAAMPPLAEVEPGHRVACYHPVSKGVPTTL